MDRALESAGYTLPASIGAGASGRAELRLRPGVDDLVVQAGRLMRRCRCNPLVMRVGVAPAWPSAGKPNSS